MQQQPQLMSQAQYARHRACDVAAVRRAIREGRINTVQSGRRVLIDARQADAQWARNTRARIDSGMPGAASADYPSLRVRRERAMVEMAERDNARAAGLLLERAEATRAAFDALRALRDAVLACPQRLAAQVLALDDVRAVESAIEDELRAALALADARLHAMLARKPDEKPEEESP